MLQVFLSSPSARPLRFASSGLTAGVVQLTLLMVLIHQNWPALPANVAAFLLAAQVNFLMSATVTWRDRETGGSLRLRWLLFNASIAATAGLNLVVFGLARELVPVRLASVSGIAAGAIGNYLAGDRLVFRQPASRSALAERPAA